jgi:TonB family protein
MGMQLLMALALTATDPSPARFTQGTLPATPGTLVAGGEVLLEVVVDEAGTVGEIRALRATPPYTERLQDAVKNWTFEPALDARGVPVPARLLVGGFYLSPSSAGLTVGDPPRDVASPSADVPFPSATVPASYSPVMFGWGQVLVEFTIAPDGSHHAVAVGDESGLDKAALDAARQWRFRPGAGPARAYVVFSFRQPTR